jgi:glutamate 5-kinase
MAPTVIKLGSSITSDERGDLRSEVLERICDETARLEQPVIVTSGAIARGVRVLDLPVRPTSIADLQAASAVGQGKLFPVYDGLLRARGRQAAQVLLTFHDLQVRTSYLNARQTLRRLVEWSVVPVVNENDTTATEEITFGDNDFLAAQIAVLLGAERLVLLTDREGLFTANPAKDPEAQLVGEVRDFGELDGLAIGSDTSPLGSGGMRSKVVAAEMATAAGIPTVICSGLEAGSLGRVLRGEPEGTRFAPQGGRQSSFKLWLKYAKPVLGTIHVDAGAARMMREGGTSLLPVGIVEVEGSFDAGDAVEICEHGGGPVGKGIVSFSAEDLRRVQGLRGPAVREALGTAGEEAVHRDYFVLA